MINEYIEVEKLRFSFSARSKLKNQALDAIRDLEHNSWPEIKKIINKKFKTAKWNGSSRSPIG